MTEKGYAVLSSVFYAYPGIIDTVVAARDINIANDYFSEIEDFCKKNKIIFYDRSELYSVRTEYMIAVSWRWTINNGGSRLIVLHDSLLPRYRGFNPLVTALINGDTTIGVTALHATTEYDRGEIIFQSASAISYPIKIQDAINVILKNYRQIAIQIADSVARDLELRGMPQCEADASYSLWRDEEDYFIDWEKPATSIKRTIDALGFPYKGAASIIYGRSVRILQAEALDDIIIANRTCGKVIFICDSKPVVVCGEGLLRIDELVDDSGNCLIPLARFRTRFRRPSEQVSQSEGDKPR